MAWIKTEAGRREMQTRSLVHARAQRNLLVLIDGKAASDELRAKIAGLTDADFEALRVAGLIERTAGGLAGVDARGTAAEGASATAPAARPAAVPASSPLPAPASATAQASSASASASALASPTPTRPLASAPASVPASESTPASSADPRAGYGHLSATLTSLISSELGLRGLPLTLAVERAQTADDLRRLADTVVTRIRERRGDAKAQAASQALFGA